MSTIARKLCNDIVEPDLKPSFTDSKPSIFLEKSVNTFTNKNNNVKPRLTLQIEKKKYSRTEPPYITGPTKNKVKFSDKGINKKKLVNSAINTFISGPLKCDSDCITLIHNRDYISCKCHSLKTNFKGNTKEIQTLSKKNFLLSDKSCTHCVETVSCGTQFVDNVNGILKQSCNRSKSKLALKVQDNNKIYKLKTKNTEQPLANDGNYKLNIKKSHILKSKSLRCGANHWAITNYPIRGPDF